MDQDDVISQRELQQSMDAEVKRVSDLFRFLLKYKRHYQPSGVEFSGLRQYLPSDDASRIDWKISAGKPDLFVKQYEEEINMDAFIIVDCSSTMTFGTADKLKSEYAAIVAAALAYASLDAAIDVGFGIFGEEQLFLTPQGGMDRYHLFLKELTTLEYYGDSFDLEHALNETIGQIKEDTALFIVSDFIDVEGDWQTKMKLASMKFRHVMSIMVRDRTDYKMPEAGNIRFEAPGSGENMVVDTGKIKEEYEKEAAKQEEEIAERVEAGGSSFLKIDTRDSFSASFAEFFDENEGGW
ncbi:DUF58 domain-containing protein [Candidatus Nanohalococcus occultus]|uniref:DUF58 family protein n=1 Tax=Candidatus Nanohalococcus occultus TaxID=2978047 RepID=A0ABY8CDL4_9ARCH|nr:DUF58 family protein [Candidatus Nanohaloarchaeota archaeon SVXNc]